MAAHVSQGGIQTIANNSTIYTGAPAAGVYTIVVQIEGMVTFVGWYNSTGATLYGSGVLVGPNASIKFGPMAANDIIVASPYGANATVVIGEIY